MRFLGLAEVSCMPTRKLTSAIGECQLVGSASNGMLNAPVSPNTAQRTSTDQLFERREATEEPATQSQAKGKVTGRKPMRSGSLRCPCRDRLATHQTSGQAPAQSGAIGCPARFFPPTTARGFPAYSASPGCRCSPSKPPPETNRWILPRTSTTFTRRSSPRSMATHSPL